MHSSVITRITRMLGIRILHQWVIYVITVSYIISKNLLCHSFTVLLYIDRISYTVHADIF